ncbi:hypothetical protein V5799_028709 [Amblyomma americanum]|uniref:Uncharacterized protein n=1 Tax=Amblyomma americanum TaxID=6943 RepID=A0AAQ4DC35_AMBAM
MSFHRTRKLFSVLTAYQNYLCCHVTYIRVMETLRSLGAGETAQRPLSETERNFFRNSSRFASRAVST